MDTIEETKNGTPLEIGGWLVLVALGIIISPLRMIYFFITTYFPIFSDGTWEALTTVGSDFYSPFWAPLLVSETVINLLMLIASFYLIFLFFSKQKSLPKWYFGLSVFTTVFIILDAYAITLVLPDMEVFDSETTREVARTLFSLLIWSPYLLFSERSKNTFIN
ncbi:DUF2569 domain-containing protein [Shewanella sp. OPT22]|nr:DUF2569 domain-containing protein [Shewanella sp. OPT22]